MKLDFIGVGFAKCGTTTVTRLLDEHPEICCSIPKEVQYFNRFKPQFSSGKSVNPNFGKPSTWYEKHWNHKKKDQKIGEFSPQYIWEEQCALRIKKLFPDVKIIICLRRPEEALMSYYNFVKFFLKQEVKEFETELNQNPQLLKLQDYYNNVKNYTDVFDRNNIHFFVLEEYIKDSEESIKKLYDFLEVDSSFIPKSLNKRFNPAKMSQSKFMVFAEIKTVEFLTSLGLSRLVQYLKSMAIVPFIRSLYTKEHKFDSISQSEALLVRKRTNENVVRLGKLLNKDFLEIWL